MRCFCLYFLRRGFFFCCAVLSLPSPQRLLLLLRCFVFTFSADASSFVALVCLYLLRRGFFFCCAVLSLLSPQRLLLLLRCFVFTFSVEASSFLVLFFFFFSFSHGPSKTAIFKLEGLVSSFGIGGLRT